MLRESTATLLLLAVSVTGFPARPAAGSRAGPAPRAATAPVLSVSGNHLVDGNGTVVRLTGVNRSGAEYACAGGRGIWAGPTDTAAAVAAIVSWHINSVRIPLNEDCWLGINGVNPRYAGASYRAAISRYVTRLERAGITPILNLHFSAPGRTIADGQAPMADEAHAPAFWASAASYFKDDPRVIFDLFNEPYPDSNRDTTAAWRCVRSGGTCPGVSFPAAGMQQLVNVVRAAGATQPLLIAGPQYAGDLDRWRQYEPFDPLHQLVASIHIYTPGQAPCDTWACWEGQIAPLAARVPVVVSEIGSKNCTGISVELLLAWLDAHGVSYLAWAWNMGSCSGEPSLISSYGGTPSRGYGAAYRDHLSIVHAGVRTPAGGMAGSCGEALRRPRER